MASEASTRVGKMALGRIWRNRMRPSFDANHSGGQDIVAFLDGKNIPPDDTGITHPAECDQGNDGRYQLLPIMGVSTAARISAARMNGKVMKTSTIRMMILSTTPP